MGSLSRRWCELDVVKSFPCAANFRTSPWLVLELLLRHTTSRFTRPSHTHMLSPYSHWSTIRHYSNTCQKVKIVFPLLFHMQITLYSFAESSAYRMHRWTTFSSRKLGVSSSESELLVFHHGSGPNITTKIRGSHQHREFSQVENYLSRSLPRGKSNVPCSSAYHGDSMIRLGPHWC